MKDTKKKFPVRIALFAVFFGFIAVSLITGYQPGRDLGSNFLSFFLEMVQVLPAVFILIGLFDVWVKRETIEKHLGQGGGAKSFFWVFILAAPMAGGLLPALPIAHELHKKGARFTVVLAFLGAVGIGRVPMVLFESTFLGIRFSLIRLIASIPLVIVTAVFMGRYLDKSGYRIPGEEP
ncbi:permease [Spirochaeta isovalerica]|uniref:Uncharacterized membrane protein YraQ (UPF0718 family) n=1 Tax=Spirochaeta isovalerica TaxID=150 RepID=A0A841RGD7_9SPIO|nr:permease [Spirochaeta isovalerica]MBB6481849.1 uncharacterized membrane protein YraQ (UPF0718 family) [Spirochaeta isovalerica]